MLLLNVHSVPAVCGVPFTTVNVLVPSKFSEINVDTVGVEGVATRLLVLPLQMVEGVAVSNVMTGKGFTTTVAVVKVPVHPMLEMELIVNVTVTGEEVVFVKVPVMFKVPFAGMPVAVLVLFRDHEYVVVPGSALLVPKIISAMELPEQIV